MNFEWDLFRHCVPNIYMRCAAQNEFLANQFWMATETSFFFSVEKNSIMAASSFNLYRFVIFDHNFVAQPWWWEWYFPFSFLKVIKLKRCLVKIETEYTHLICFRMKNVGDYTGSFEVIHKIWNETRENHQSLWQICSEQFLKDEIAATKRWQAVTTSPQNTRKESIRKNNKLCVSSDLHSIQLVNIHRMQTKQN
jgi:hypothetical protein